MNTRSISRLPLLLPSVIGALGLLATALQAQESREPDFTRPLFLLADLPLSPDEASALVVSLVELAKQEDLDPVLKAKALAFAFTVDPKRWEVIETNFALRNRIPFSGFSRPRSKEEVLAELQRLRPLIEAVDKTLFWKATEMVNELIGPVGPASEPTSVATESEDFPRESAQLGGVFLTDISVTKTMSPIETRWRYLAASMKPMTVSATVHKYGNSGSSITVVKGQQPPELASAMREMVKMYSLRNVTIPKGNRIEVAFEEEYAHADGPSGVLSLALLVDALVNDTDLDPEFAPIGDLNADGSIQSVFHLRGRILATQPEEGDSGIKLIAVPEKNAARLSDILLIDGIEPIFKTQIFTVKTFDEARALAAAPEVRDAGLQEGIELFAEIQAVMLRSNALGLLSNQHVRERLTKVIELVPNHASAKLLLLRGANRHPQKLTLGGSLDEMLHAYVYLERGRSPKYDSLQTALNALANVQSAFDPRSLDWLDSINKYQYALRQRSLNLSGTQANEVKSQIAQSLNRVELEYQKLMSDPEAREALMR